MRLASWHGRTRTSEELGPLPFDLEIVQAGVALEGLDQGEYVVAIGALVPEDGWFATPLARDPIAVVSGSGAGVSEVTRHALVDLLAGRTLRWSELGGNDRAVQPVLPLPGDDLRQVLDELLMLGRPFASGSRLIATPDQALGLLEEDPGALALLPLSSLPAGSIPLRLDGVLPESEVRVPGQLRAGGAGRRHRTERAARAGARLAGVDSGGGGGVSNRQATSC